ncbi:MAG: hypothetical protein ACLSEY_14175 [Enterocloster sp.]
MSDEEYESAMDDVFELHWNTKRADKSLLTGKKFLRKTLEHR